MSDVKLTVDAIMAMRPCPEYTRERVEQLWAGSDSLTPLDIASLDIPILDRLWTLLRPEIILERTLHELACEWAEEVLPIFEREYPDDKRPRLAIDAKRAWLRGEINKEQLAAAWDAARDAARDAAWAARDAAWDAAWAARAAAWAARDAAWDAAWAARAAAGDAARDAARDAAWAARDAAWAARDAAGDAARDAAWAAAGDAAWAAANQRQLDRVIDILKEAGK